jgi:phosphoglycerate-specific signal transduction histidine kinase
MNWIQWLAVWFLVSAIATPFIGDWLARVREKQEANAEMQELLDKAQYQTALIEAVKNDIQTARDKARTSYFEALREESEAFMLDDNDQPHLDGAA